MNYKTVLNTVGKVFFVEAIMLLLPAAVSLIYGESCVFALLITAAITAVLGALLVFLFPCDRKKLNIRNSFAIVALSWIGASLLGSIPFMLSGEIANPADAFFETVSGFTTTGASILTDVESMSKGLLFWRSFTHWLGGMGILVFVMAVTGKTTDRSINILRAEMPGHTVDKFTPKSRNTAKMLYCIYITLTVLEIVFLLLGGMPLFDSTVHALGTAGTGGFGIKADSLASYSPYIQWVITVFMLLFGISFNVYYLLIMRRWKSVLTCNELWCYLCIFAVSATIITLNIYPLCDKAFDAVRLAAFQVSSVLTTTGYATTDFDLWPQLSKVILLLLMFCGGCMGSTSGGFKIYRVNAMFQLARNELRRSVSPNSVSVVKLNGRTLSSKEETSLLCYLVLYIGVIIFTFVLISFEPFGFETNFTAVIACINNIGPGFAAVGPTGNYSAYSDFSKIVLSFAMLMGRLEIYPLVSVLLPRYGTASGR